MQETDTWLRILHVQAPVVAHGNDLDYWDANNARALVNARGMEFQNHWGAHDPDVELPSEQLNAFFGTRAEYWTPSSKPKAASGHAQIPPGHPGPAPGHPQASTGHLKSPSGLSSGQQRRAGAGGNAAPTRAGSQAAGSAASGMAASAVSQVRAQRAADRAHNEAVLGDTDEHVAQALAGEERQVGRQSKHGQQACKLVSAAFAKPVTFPLLLTPSHASGQCQTSYKICFV